MTTIVVGHGRSPEGRSWGSRIDSCKTVIRLWDNEWQNPSDCGQKYDYGLFVLTPKGLSVFSANNKRTPARGWLAYMGKPTTGGSLPDKTILVDPTPWVQAAQAMGGAGLNGRLTLTRGCVAAAWALTRQETVVLVGFDNVLAKMNQPIEESFHPTYWKLYNSRFVGKLEKSYPTGTSKTETHDMAVELPLLKQLAKERDVQLQFAQECW